MNIEYEFAKKTNKKTIKEIEYITKYNWCETVTISEY